MSPLTLGFLLAISFVVIGCLVAYIISLRDDVGLLTLRLHNAFSLLAEHDREANRMVYEAKRSQRNTEFILALQRDALQMEVDGWRSMVERGVPLVVGPNHGIDRKEVLRNCYLRGHRQWGNNPYTPGSLQGQWFDRGVRDAKMDQGAGNDPAPQESKS